MAGSGILIDYHGPIDYPAIESMLAKLKSLKAYNDLTTIIRKRTYSLFVESMDNIFKHSALKSTDDVEKMPRVSLKDTEDKIVIRTCNPINVEKKDKLIHKIDAVNGKEYSELRKMHEERINTGFVEGENGAGLGFICMALKSGNKLAYSFRDLPGDYLFFELEISLNK